jgi:hypothetical protein
MYSLCQIRQFSHGRFPFAARMQDWSSKSCAVIIDFHPYLICEKMRSLYRNHAVGIVLTNGKRNPLLINDPLYKEHALLPKTYEPVWLPVKDADLSLFERKDVHGLEDILQFGKYKTREIKHVIDRDPHYLHKMMEQGHITLTEESIDYIKSKYHCLKPSVFEINEKRRELIFCEAAMRMLLD